MGLDLRGGPGSLDGVQAIEAVKRGDITASFLYRDAQARTDSWEPRLGAVTGRIPYETPADGPLLGMIVGVKNQIDVAGQPNWWAMQSGSSGAPARDAPVVSRLRKAGATLFCTTSAPFIGAPGGVTPQTLNPRKPDRVSGGSSGGSAAAVAAGLVHVALGTDSGGSIRIPAACCGVVGMQATRGLIPLERAGSLTYSIGTVGPIATTASDCRMVLDAVAGFQQSDPYSVPISSVDGWEGGPLRLGVPLESVESLDEEVETAFFGALAALGAAGHQVDELSLPWFGESIQLGPQVIGVVESGTILEDELGRMAGLNEHVASAVARSQAITGPELARAHHRIAEIRASLRGVFSDFDFLLTPTLPCTVPSATETHREVMLEVGGVVESRTAALTRLANPWNLAALPAGTVPIASDSCGAPISLQVVGAPFSDWSLLDMMALVEVAVGGPWDTVGPE